jgi:hypothetical protein
MAKKSTVIVLERRLLMSQAFRQLRTAAAHQVLMIFMSKRRVEKEKLPRRTGWVITNNGEITFTYREAEKKCGLSPARFRNAVDELIAKGFIDIAGPGMGVYKVTTFYSISDRWRNYGTDQFVKKDRRRGLINRGFQKGNQYGRNCRREKNSTIAG